MKLPQKTKFIFALSLILLGFFGYIVLFSPLFGSIVEENIGEKFKSSYFIPSQVDPHQQRVELIQQRLQYWNNPLNQDKKPFKRYDKFLSWHAWDAGLNNR